MWQKLNDGLNSSNIIDSSRVIAYSIMHSTPPHNQSSSYWHFTYIESTIMVSMKALGHFPWIFLPRQFSGPPSRWSLTPIRPASGIYWLFKLMGNLIILIANLTLPPGYAKWCGLLAESLDPPLSACMVYYYLDTVCFASRKLHGRSEDLSAKRWKYKGYVDFSVKQDNSKSLKDDNDSSKSRMPLPTQPYSSDVVFSISSALTTHV